MIILKKSLLASFIYLILGLIGGAFYREFTKFYEFTGKTMLSVIHTHLFILGTVLFLILALIIRDKKLDSSKELKRFFIAYNIFLPLFIVMLLTRGILDVLDINITNGINGMVSGIAGLTHIGLTISLLLLIPVIKNGFNSNEIK